MTAKVKQRKGFALNKDNINKGGRPKGSKSKDKTKEAIQRLDANKLTAAQVFIEVVSGRDPSKDTDLKVSDMMKAAQIVMTMPDALRKGLDGIKDEEEDTETVAKVSDDDDGNKVVALVSMKPRKE